MPIDPLSTLIDEMVKGRREASEGVHGATTISVASLTLMVEAGVISRESVVSRLQEFLDAIPPERRDGQQGFLLQQVIEMFRPGAPPPDPRQLFEVIEGGLSQKD